MTILHLRRSVLVFSWCMALQWYHVTFCYPLYCSEFRPPFLTFQLFPEPWTPFLSLLTPSWTLDSFSKTLTPSGTFYYFLLNFLWTLAYLCQKYGPFHELTNLGCFLSEPWSPFQRTLDSFFWHLWSFSLNIHLLSTEP